MTLAPRKIRRCRPACIEPLESRIAPAAVVSAAGGNVSVSDGNANAGDHVTVSFSGGNFQFSDPGGITASGLAVQVNGSTVTVAGTALTGTLSVLLGEGSNAVTFSAGLPLIAGLLVDTATLGALPALNIGANALHITTSASDIAVGGDISVGGELTLNALGTGTSVTIGANLTATGDIVLEAAGTITAAAGAVINAPHVGLAGAGGVGLSGGAVSVVTGTLAASTGTTGGGVFVSSANAFTIGVVTNAFLSLTITGVNTFGQVSLSALNAPATLTLAADISAGNGAVTLSSAGDLALGAQNISTTGPVTLIADSGSAGLGAITSTSGQVNAGTLTASAAQGITLNISATSVSATNSFTNDISLSQASGTSAALSIVNAGSGNLDLFGGTFHPAAGASITAADVVVTGTLDLAGSNLTIGGLGGTGTVINSGAPATLKIASPLSTTFSGVIAGNLALVITGTGTEDLAGANTYTGGTTIASGTLEFQSLGSIPSGTMNLAGGTLLYALPAGVNQVASPVVLTANSTVAVAAGGEIDWQGNVNGGFQFTKTGPGTLLSAAASFAVKSIDIQQGALGTSKSGGLGSAPITVEMDAALWTEDSAGLANNITLEGGAGASVNAPNAQPGALRNAGPGLSVLTGKIILAGDSTIGTDGGDFSLNGVVSGAGNLTKVSPGILILQDTHNTFGNNGTVTIDGGTVQISGDGALGNSGNSVVFNNGTLATTSTLTTHRHMSLASGTATFAVTGTLTLAGLVDGTGTLVDTGSGSLLFGMPFTGTTAVSNGAITVASTKVGITGAGDVEIHVVSDGHGGTVISSVELQNTDATTKLTITGPGKNHAPVMLDQIISTDPNGEIGSIALGTSVILGDGLNDAVPAVAIAGKVDNLSLNDVSAFATLRLGSGLPYNTPESPGGPDTYNNAPNITMRNILGQGVNINVTGDGTPGGIGGGGLGRVVINSWPFAGTVQTTQSIGSFRLNHGDCNVVFLVDPLHNGEFTIANIGTMTIANGAWGSSGSEIEGTVGTFSASSFLASATISAGNISKLLVRKGVYAGTTTLTDPSSPGLHTVSVIGDFLGSIQTPASVINVSVRGDFKGSLEAASIGSISAYSFDGTTTDDGFGDPDRADILASSGSLGTLTTSAGGIVNYEIAALTSFKGFNIKDATGMNNLAGLDNVSVEAGDIGAIKVNLKAGIGVIGILNSTFETNSAGLGTILSVTSSHSIVDSIFAASTNIGPVKIGGTDPAATLTGSEILAGTSLANPVLGGPPMDSYTLAGKIASVTVKGAVTATTIAAGINPEDGIYGDGDDLAAAGSPATPDAIGALIFGAGSGAVNSAPGLLHDNAIEAASIRSLTIGTNPAIKTFTAPLYLQLGGSEAASDMLVELI